MPTQNVNLTIHFKKFIESNVRTGRFGNASEVVRAGLRLLENEQTLRELKIQRLREAARVGLDDIAAGRFIDLPVSEISRHLGKISRSSLPKASGTR